MSFQPSSVFWSMKWIFSFSFKEEKNFVWSLWKKLQTEKPDLSSVVSLVMARYLICFFDLIELKAQMEKWRWDESDKKGKEGIKKMVIKRGL